MRILIYGINELNGSQFSKILSENDITLIEGKSKVDDIVSLEKEIEYYNPTHIISFMERNQPIIGEKNFIMSNYLEQRDCKLHGNDSIFYPFLLNEICSQKNIHYTHIEDKFEKNYISYFKNIINKDIKSNDNCEDVNLLITGGCGFIGSNFINYYFPKNKISKLVNIDAMYYCANETNIDKTIRESNNYTLVKGNICDSNLVEHILNEYKITHIIHFAAQSHVQNSFEDSLTFTKDNILGTHTLLESCRKYGKVKRIIHVSTDEVYGESMNSVDEKHKTEHSILCPTNPYAATKAGAELIAQSYNHSYGTPIIITRGNNVYGPNQYPEKLIPKFIKLLKDGHKVTIQGNGTAVRAFLHSYDTATAFETILEKGKIGEIYNIGCDEGMEYSVMDIAKLLIKMIKNTDKYNEWIEYIEDRPFNDQRYYISNQKLKDLGWKIQIDLKNGIKEII